MTIDDVATAVEAGRCDWGQVHDTLANSRLTKNQIARVTDGRRAIGPYAQLMLEQLIESGEVPLQNVPEVPARSQTPNL